VGRYLDAWGKAAAAGVVDPADSLVADSEYDWEASGLTQKDWAEYYEEARYPTQAEKDKKRPPSKKDVADAIKADPSLVADAVKDSPEVADAAWDAMNEQNVERAKEAQLAAIQRGGKVTPIKPKPSKFGTAWEDAMKLAKRGEVLQELEEFVDGIEAAAKMVEANGAPQDNEGEQIKSLANRIADVSAKLFNLTLEVSAR